MWQKAVTSEELVIVAKLAVLKAVNLRPQNKRAKAVWLRQELKQVVLVIWLGSCLGFELSQDC